MVIEAHPELDAEQRHVDHAYACLRMMYERVSRFGEHGANQFERDVFDAWKAMRLHSLADDRSALVFGRIDAYDASPARYIGRRHVEDREGDVVVVDWRAPVSIPFYRASVVDPLGLRRRRHFLVEGPRILGVADEHFEPGAAEGEADDATRWRILRAALERRRGGEMRDIVATIQAEQDVIIRAPLPGVLVVQGGPGTGKTAVGLHRAAFLLYEHRRTLARQGVLVVGPNRIFMRYVSQVLPSLGESAVEQRAIEELVPPMALTADEPPAASRLKGDARMALVVERHVWSQLREPDEPVRVRVGRETLELSAERLRELMSAARETAASYRAARERFLHRVLTELFREHERRVEASTLSFDDFERAVRSTPALQQARKLWPTTTPEKVVRALLAPAALRKAADGVLTPAEQKTVTTARGRWARSDIALVDEARAQLEGSPGSFGHVIVDEAQDLSPMQLRMIARRSPAGSMTVLGDLAQATGPSAHRTWQTVLEHLPSNDEQRVEELTIGYRVSAPIMRVAARVLAEVDATLTPPRSAREDGTVEIVRTSAEDLPRDAAAVAIALARTDGAIAIITPHALMSGVEAALQHANAAFVEAGGETLDAPITVVAARDCKGLEFDGVVLVEPQRIVDDEEMSGLNRLYVCITRAMRDLVVVHADALPPAMQPAAAERAAG